MTIHRIDTGQLELIGFHVMGNINRKWVKGGPEMTESSSTSSTGLAFSAYIA